MTYQEILWENKRVRVTGIRSRNGPHHVNADRYFGRCGTVIREAKNGWLLVAFDVKPGEALVSIPARCLTAICT